MSATGMVRAAFNHIVVGTWQYVAWCQSRDNTLLTWTVFLPFMFALIAKLPFLYLVAGRPRARFLLNRGDPFV